MTTQTKIARTIALQTLAWTPGVSVILMFCFTLGRFDFYDDRLYSLSTILSYVVAAFGLVLFATLHYYLAYLPYFTERRYGTYAYAGMAIYTLAAFFCFLGFSVIDRSVFMTSSSVWQTATHAVWIVLIFGVPFVILYTALHEARKARARRKEIEAASRQTSMLLLAKKLEPHFLFNALNAIYAIAQQEESANTVAAIDNISEKLRGLMNPKGEIENYMVKKRKTDSFPFQFLLVWLGILLFMAGLSVLSYLSTGVWEREPARFWIYQPVMIALVAFTITAHFYLLYKPYLLIGQWRRYFALLLPFAVVMILLDVSVNYLLLNVFEIFGKDDERIGRFFLVAAARVLTAEAICAWVYATVSHYRHTRRQRDAALKEQQINEHKLQQSKSMTDAMFALLRELEDAVGKDAAPRTQAAAAELLSLFRYSAEHAGDITVPVAEEFTFLQRYINLQQMRIRQGAGVRITATVATDNGEARIAPMLLLPYIENAFKYGISYAADSFIDIGISVKGGTLSCSITNTDHAAAKRGRPSAGMGMADTLKRLQLQYEGKFSLESGSADGIYTLKLQLALG